MKYIDEQGEMRTLIAERHAFKGVKNYFTNSVLYQDSLEIAPDIEQPDSRDEADEEPESDDDCLWELNVSMIDHDDTNMLDTTFEGGEWYLDDQNTLGTTTTLRDGKWYINDLKASDVTDATNDRVGGT